MLDFNVKSLGKEPEWEVKDNEWDDGGKTKIQLLGLILGGGRIVLTSINDNPPFNDDSWNEDFIEDGEEIDGDNDSENVFLEEETNSSDYGVMSKWEFRLSRDY